MLLRPPCEAKNTVRHDILSNEHAHYSLDGYNCQRKFAGMGYALKLDAE